MKKILLSLVHFKIMKKKCANDLINPNLQQRLIKVKKLLKNSFVVFAWMSRKTRKFARIAKISFAQTASNNGKTLINQKKVVLYAADKK